MNRCCKAVSALIAGALLLAALPPAISHGERYGQDLEVVDFSSEHADPGGTNDLRAVLSVDGNPDTYWSNDYRPKADPPHFIVLDLGSEVYVTGIAYLPRQDGYTGTENGNLGTYRVSAGQDRLSFDEVHAGSFDPRTSKESRAIFEHGVHARFIELRTDQEWIAVAELKVLTGPADGSTPTPAPTGATGAGSIRTDRPVYEQGDDVQVAYTGAPNRGTWVGICGEEASRYQGHSIGVWLYANSGTKAVGPERRASGTVVFSASEFGSRLVPGEYAAYLMSDDWTTELAAAHFIIVRKGGDTSPPSKPDAPSGLNYERSATRSGLAAGRITVLPPADPKGLRGFELYWSDGNGRLPFYSHLAYVLYEAGKPPTWEIPAGVFFPPGARGILAYSRSWGSLASDAFASTPLDPAVLLPDSRKLQSFEVVSDLHLASDSSHPHDRHFEEALRDIVATDAGSAGVFTVGDNTDHGTESEWMQFKRIIESVLTSGLPPVHAALGNHDFGVGTESYDPIALFRQYTGATGPYYSLEEEGSTFVVLTSQAPAGESGDANLLEEQLQWLTTRLEEASKKGGPIFLFLHVPFQDTVSGSLYSVDPAVQVWTGMGLADEYHALIDRYPQAVLFTGHTHWQFESLQPFLPGDGTSANYLNSSSVAYLWTDDNTGREGSQGYQVEVYEDHVLVRGRDFVQKEWVSVAQFLLDVRTPVPTVAPTTPVPDEEPPGTRFPFWIVLAALAVLVGLAVLVVLRIRNACIRAALR